MPWTQLHAQIHTLLKAKFLLPPDSSILMAVSGGQDSLCMAQLLMDLQPKWNWRLGLLHCDHGWRDDSSDNAAHVARLAQQWQLPFFLETAVDLVPTEAAARTWRYEKFADIAQTHGYAYVVTGHTATDRAETVLFNLLRGSGADGIQALSWQRPLGAEGLAGLVTRPLLAITRQQTGEFCQDRDLPIWQDASNDDWRYRRNRIRQELMPYLRSHFNPSVEATLAQTAEIFTAEVTYLENQAAQLHSDVVETSPGVCRIRRFPLREAPLALQRRVVRRVLQAVLDQQPSFDHIEKLVCLATAPNRSQTDPFPGGVIAYVDADWIKISKPPLVS
ncbi:tRNA lysidine(34) synthetase TilS [Leptothoe kymatousa]|uniref:tRNA(Ile)-lysidine synthase n=1 Tax=Leptothoe kymatousa TAU-MAC 1615 TaxID=2364775 RepID=A0ABS5Y6H2_9CYAN|nr:tRNA lysidine(34) synthetase TilS [Leptothoe kymatousa]MBT9313371.1 tRNA lysidine(34) synthetase TilS [Leptothoe kymatousa TAU-MAC 1615]